MHVIGTAGHVDHGKTLLIEALTGINADRLPEERKRGMTIDLGFAHFSDPQGTPIGVIDVPGHERFIRNMVAGAWGLDCALLTVAADDGWMPQSEEHLQILNMLNIQTGIIAITKIDLAEPEWLALVEEDVKAKARGTILENAPVVKVSSTEKIGVDKIYQEIVKMFSGLQRRLRFCSENSESPDSVPVRYMILWMQDA